MVDNDAKPRSSARRAHSTTSGPLCCNVFDRPMLMSMALGHPRSATGHGQVAPGVSEYQVGEMIYVYPVAHCLRCDFCRSGHSEQCPNVEEYTEQPGGFAQYIAYGPKRVERGATFKVPDGVLYALIRRSSNQRGVKL